MPNLKFDDVYKLIVLGLSTDQLEFIMNYSIKNDKNFRDTAKLYDEVRVLELENTKKVESIESKKEEEKLANLLRLALEKEKVRSTSDDNNSMKIALDHDISSIEINEENFSNSITETSSPKSSELVGRKSDKEFIVRNPDRANIPPIKLLNTRSELPKLNLCSNLDTFIFKKNFNYFINTDSFPLVDLDTTLNLRKYNPNKPNKQAEKDLNRVLSSEENVLGQGDKSEYDKDELEAVHKKRKL